MRKNEKVFQSARKCTREHTRKLRKNEKKCLKLRKYVQSVTKGEKLWQNAPKASAGMCAKVRKIEQKCVQVCKSAPKA